MCFDEMFTGFYFVFFFIFQPTFYQGNQGPPEGEEDGGYAELAQANSNEV